MPVAPTTKSTNTTEIEIHPDVLFALGLADAPAAKRGTTDSYQ